MKKRGPCADPHLPIILVQPQPPSIAMMKRRSLILTLGLSETWVIGIIRSVWPSPHFEQPRPHVRYIHMSRPLLCELLAQAVLQASALQARTRVRSQESTSPESLVSRF